MVLVIGQNSTWQNMYRFTTLRSGEVNRIVEVAASAAGKGANVVRALGLLGSPALLLAYAGGPNGRKFMDACARDGVAAEFTPTARETRVCTTLIESSGVITELVEPAPRIDAAERDAFHAAFDRRIDSARMLVIAGTAMDGESPDCYLRFVQEARRRGIPTLLDSYREHGKAALAAGPEILKVNAHELAEITGMPVATAGERGVACARIAAQFGVRWIIITRGAEGAESYDGRRSVVAATPAVKVVNTIGSGDSVTAGIVARLMRERSGAPFPDGADIADALRLGVAAGTANCMTWKPGAFERSDLDWVFDRVTLS